MGNECNPSKPHYDINLSKRTRKPLNLETEADRSPQKAFSPEKESSAEGVNKEEQKEEEKVADEGEKNDHKSLKQLIKVDGESNKGRCPLGQHFTEEKQQLQLVVKQQEDGLDGVKFKRLVSRYARVLSRLIKVKRDPRLGSRRKPVLRLAM